MGGGLPRRRSGTSASRSEEWTDERDELPMDLLAQEAMHEGQMIRHGYGLERSLPGLVEAGMT